VPATGTAAPKLEPVLEDALKSLKFAMKIILPTATELQHGKVAPLVNGIPKPDLNRKELNLGDTIVILRRVVGL
jgi:sulfur carrier protein ThiS